jgi:hypothetical protein
MSKRWSLLLFVVLLLATATLGAREPSPPFAVEIRLTTNGIAAECKHGCDWISLSGSCKPGQRCHFLVSQTGIASVPEP